MVSTRATNDSPPATPRSASSRRKSGKASASATASASPTRARSKSRGRQPANASASNSVAKRAASRSTAPTPRAARSSNTFSHTPSPITLLWLGISLPLVVWDTGYVLGRPHTMEGGWAHWPMYSPYKLYGEVDHIYGWPALHANNGFTAAQGFLNVLETLMYAAYLWLWYSRGTAPRGQPVTAKAVAGKYGALAVLIAFSAAVMTLSKTVLYWANEFYSGFNGIGHNTPFRLLFLWIIPNGAWLVGSGYMIASLGKEIHSVLEGASPRSKRD